MLLIDRNTRFLSEGFAIQVLTVNLGDVTRVARDMLSFHVLGGTTEPVLSVLGVVTVLKILVVFILSWWV